MRETHSIRLISIFALTAFIFLGFFGLANSQAFADEGYRGKSKHSEWKKEKGYQKEYQKHRHEINRDNRKHYEEQAGKSRKYQREQDREALKHRRDIRDYYMRPDFHKYHGYRERPYDEHRHYVRHNHKGRGYNYQGHWRSWDQWDRYARKHPEIYRHGAYYRENAHLMFRFCDPVTGNCFFFSIGR